MAITAGITLTSAAGDLVTDALVLSTSTNLTKAGSATALSQTSGLARKTTTSASQYILFDADDYPSGPAKAGKIYLKNTETSAALFFTISIDTKTIGRIYAGDFAFLPWSNVDGTNDIKITPSTSASHTLEYMLFYE
jgi:hypothetical protein